MGKFFAGEKRTEIAAFPKLTLLKEINFRILRGRRKSRRKTVDKGVSGMRKSYDFFSFFVIPALTLLLAAGHELTETNFSVIGNREGRRGLFPAN